jgi:predicted CoA-binding protein
MKIKKKTLVIGASLNPERYSHHAVLMLREYDHPVEAIGLREGEIGGVRIRKPFPDLEGIHTITVYLGKNNQLPYYDYILQIHPRRVIFNPGAENEELEKILAEKGIEVVRACTLVMIVNGQF